MVINLNSGLKGYATSRTSFTSSAIHVQPELGAPLHKRQRFCTTFCDLKNQQFFDIQPGKSEADLATFLSKLKGRERLKVVCIDLSSSYRSLIRRYFPNAHIVVDRLHVVRVASNPTNANIPRKSRNHAQPAQSQEDGGTRGLTPLYSVQAFWRHRHRDHRRSCRLVQFTQRRGRVA